MSPRSFGARRIAQVGSVLLAGLTLASCAGQAATRAREVEARSQAGGSPLERVVVADRPPLTLVARSGDPRAAVALALSHARGGAASTALAGVLSARLEAMGVTGVDVRAHGLGIEAARLVDSAAEVERFVDAMRAALEQPIAAGDPGLARAARELATLSALTFAGPGDAAAAACSGELGLPDGLPPLELATAAGVSRVEAAREASFRVDAAAFAALGPQPILEAAAHALNGSSAWPNGSADADPWPERDAVTVDASNGGRRLTLALRVGDANAAIGAALELGAPRSKLLERLDALNPPWTLERASAIARRRGGCLRLDLAPPRGDPSPSATELGRVLALLEAESAEALTHAEPGALDESVLRPSDPLRAAALAAWRALPSHVESLAQRSIALYVSSAADRTSASDIARAFGAAQNELARPPIELVSRAEAGQGELFILLGSPCGTGAEGTRDAGALGLGLRAMATLNRDASVRLEPWVAADGAGLLAHAPRLDASETPLQHAERVAAALGQALTARLEGAALSRARADLLDDFGGRPFVGWSLALEGLVPGHPSWLEPRGTWSSISELSSEAVERARRRFFAEPLRLAVLTTRGDQQAEAAAKELSSWLLPARPEVAACQVARADVPRRGEARFEAFTPNAPIEGAYVALLFDPPGRAAARAAALAEGMLNLSSGQLRRALAEPSLAATARARALGGEKRPALVLEVRALPDRLDQAVARARAILAELAPSGGAAEDRTSVGRELSQAEATARFNPRRRIVELFTGARAAEPEPSAVQASWSAALALGAHWVVLPARSP